MNLALAGLIFLAFIFVGMYLAANFTGSFLAALVALAVAYGVFRILVSK